MRIMLLVPVLLLSTLVCEGPVAGDPSPVVSTIYGDVQGERLTDIYDRLHDDFLGIPYAKPPMGELRWQKPQPPDPWADVLQTTEYQDHCYQVVNGGYRLIGLSTNHSEDCLYLDVHVPRGVDAQPELRPVMVYFYGGGFIFGAQEMYPPQHLANFGDVIVVTFDYRVSAMGFMTSGDAACPGNFGLWDAQLALTWVQQNIASFGGDPNRVTIFGQSAGGALVSLSTVAPSMSGLFQSAIAMSGGSIGYLGTRENTYNYLMTQYLGDIFDCNSTDSQEIIDCLKLVDGDSIVFWGSTGVIPSKNITIILRPTVDYDFFPEEPGDSHARGVNRDINFMTGHCQDDAGGTVVGNFFGLPINRTDGEGGQAETIQEVNEQLYTMFAAAGNKDELIDLVVGEYPELYSDDRQTRTLEFSETQTDWHYAAASHGEAEYHSSAGGLGRTYRYKYQYAQSFLFYPDWMNGTHTEELYSVFGQPYLVVARLLWFQFGDFTDEDFLMSNNMMSYMTNFAHTNDPNTGPNPVPAFWPEYDSTSKDYQLLTLYPYTESMNDYPDKLDKYDFWNNEFYEAVQPPDLTSGQDGERLRFFFTDEELEELVDKMKTLVRSSSDWDDESWAETSDHMDGFLEKRQKFIAERRATTHH